MDTPDCYGHISLGYNSPCKACGIRALCASKRTRNERFGLLLWPRTVDTNKLQKEVNLELRTMEKIDPDVMSKVHSGLALAGLHCRNKIWKWNKKTFLRVVQANEALVIFEFPTVSPIVIQCATTFNRTLKVVPMFLKNDLRTESTRMPDIVKMRERAPGSIVHFSNPSDAVTLALETLRNTDGEPQ